jgi:hypothetical protein
MRETSGSKYPTPWWWRSVGAVTVGDRAIHALKPHLPRSAYRHLHDHDLAVLVDMREAVHGLVLGRFRNLLVQNFWNLLTGLLGEANVESISTGGTVYGLRSSGDMNQASSFVTFGTGTVAPAFSQTALQTRVTGAEGAAITPTVVSEPDRIRLRFGRVTAASVNEVGLYQNLYDTTSTVRETMHGRVVIPSIPSGRNVFYDVVVQAPFLTNFANLLFGILSESNQSAVNRGGASVTLRSSGDVNVEACRLLAGTSNAPFDFGQYELTGPLALASAYNFFITRGSSTLAMISGATRVPSAISIGEIGIAQRLYDTGAVAQDVLLARIVLSTPVSKAAGEVFSAIVTLFAGT